jgi:hypothetical protein
LSASVWESTCGSRHVGVDMWATSEDAGSTDHRRCKMAFDAVERAVSGRAGRDRGQHLRERSNDSRASVVASRLDCRTPSRHRQPVVRAQKVISSSVPATGTMSEVRGCVRGASCRRSPQARGRDRVLHDGAGRHVKGDGARAFSELDGAFQVTGPPAVHGRRTPRHPRTPRADRERGSRPSLLSAPGRTRQNPRRHHRPVRKMRPQ